MRVFISSPYSNGDTLPESERIANVHRSIDAAEQLVARGHVPFLPLLSHYWQQQVAHDHGFWLWWCLEWLSASDAMLRLDGTSVGASIEERAAREVGIPVYYSVKDIPGVGNEAKD